MIKPRKPTFKSCLVLAFTVSVAAAIFDTQLGRLVLFTSMGLVGAAFLYSKILRPGTSYLLGTVLGLLQMAKDGLKKLSQIGGRPSQGDEPKASEGEASAAEIPPKDAANSVTNTRLLN